MTYTTHMAISLPIGDWQFWVVTALAAVALGYVLREVVPGNWWPWKRKPRGKSASLTIEGKTPTKPRDEPRTK